MHYKPPRDAPEFYYSEKELAKAKAFDPKDESLLILWEESDPKLQALSNTACLPIYLFDKKVANAEIVYHALKFSNNPDLQETILASDFVNDVRVLAEQQISHVRPDWETIKIDVMRWVLRAKFSHNIKEMRGGLLFTRNKELVVRSLTDDYWGAILMHSEKDVLVGKNILGYLLKELLHEYLFFGNVKFARSAVIPSTLHLWLLKERISFVSTEHRRAYVRHQNKLKKNQPKVRARVRDTQVK